MKTPLLVLAVILLATLLHLLLPWYSIVLAGLAVGAMSSQKSTTLFMAGLLGGIILWGGYALYTNMANDSLLATRLGQTFGGLSPLGMVAVTAVVGGLYAGLGAMVGNLARQWLAK